MTIRRARPDDAAAFVSLVCALAEFEKLPPPGEGAQKRLVEHAFGEHPKFELFVAELDGEIVAYAAVFVTYSTFRALPSLYLEDLFVHPDARRRGIATAMMKHLREEAVARGCGRLEWTVLDWNEGAQKLYDGLGAAMLDEWRIMRVALPDPA